MVRAAPWFWGLPSPSPSWAPEGEAAAGRGVPTKSHKCTLIPGDIEAARGAEKMGQGLAGEPCAYRLGEG